MTKVIMNAGIRFSVLPGVAGVLMLFSGCATIPTYTFYPGPQRTEKEIIRIIIPSELEVVHVDGQKVTDPALRMHGGGARELHFLSGVHYADVRLVVTLGQGSSHPEVLRSSVKLVELRGKPGFCYRLTTGSTPTTLESARLHVANPKFGLQMVSP